MVRANAIHGVILLARCSSPAPPRAPSDNSSWAWSRWCSPPSTCRRLRGHRPHAADVRAPPSRPRAQAPDAPRRGAGVSTAAELVYLLCAVGLHHLALKGLSGRVRARRQPGRAAAARGGVAVPFVDSGVPAASTTCRSSWPRSRSAPWRRGPGPAGADDPDAADGGPLNASAAARPRSWRSWSSDHQPPWRPPPTAPGHGVFDVAATVFIHRRGRLGPRWPAPWSLRQAPGADDLPSRALPRPSRVSFAVGLVAAVVLAVLCVRRPSVGLGIRPGRARLALGVLLVLPVGGADVPIVISLLNAFTGLSDAAGGYVLANTTLLVAGTLVGASATFLTLLMAGRWAAPPPTCSFRRPARRLNPRCGRGSDRPVRSAGPADVAILLPTPSAFIVVPGYGLAVPSPAHPCASSSTCSARAAPASTTAIHPVAGRMPGHMNVLLAEAQVPYEQLSRWTTSTPTTPPLPRDRRRARRRRQRRGQTPPPAPPRRRRSTACDPRRRPGPPGRLPQALDAPRLRRIENDLLHEPTTTLLFGDAKDSLTRLLAALKAL